MTQKSIGRAEVIARLLAHMPEADAEDLFGEALRVAGLPDRRTYTPAELMAIAKALMAITQRLAAGARAELLAQQE